MNLFTVNRPASPLPALLAAGGVAGACGAFVHANGFLWLAAIASAVALGLAWPWASVRGVRVTLRVAPKAGADRGREGESLDARLTVRNRLPWPVYGLVLRPPTSASAGDVALCAAAGCLPRVGGRRTVVYAFSFVPPCRGECPTAAPRAACGFPFGLWERQRTVEVAGRALVWPRALAVGAVPDAADGRPGGEPGRRAGPSGERSGVRPWRRGDSPRQVHWGQTARHDRLIVCERHADAGPAARVVLDDSPDAYANDSSADGDGAFEWAVRVSASLIAGWCAAGSAVEAVVGGRSIRCPAHATPRAALDALARLAAPDAGRPPTTIVAGDGGTVVVTTDRGGVRRHRAGGPRFVVLRAAGFGGGVGPAIGGRGWIEIDSPADVAPRLLTTGRGAGRSRSAPASFASPVKGGVHVAA